MSQKSSLPQAAKAVSHVLMSDIGHDEIESLCRARHGRGDSLAEDDRARRAWGRELYDPKLLADDEVGIEPPTQIAVEPLGPINVRDRDDDHLELHVDPRRSRGLDCSFAAHLLTAHVRLLRFGCLGIVIRVEEQELSSSTALDHRYACFESVASRAPRQPPQFLSKGLNTGLFIAARPKVKRGLAIGEMASPSDQDMIRAALETIVRALRPLAHTSVRTGEKCIGESTETGVLSTTGPGP
jgi:hypothetical protein